MSIVASYFGFNTGSAEREAETTTIDIRNTFGIVSNMQGVGIMTFLVNPLRSWILLIVLQILLTLPFVPSFRPPPLARVVPPQSIFAVYRQTLFGLSEILIHSLVLDDVIFKPYHKALITRLYNLYRANHMHAREIVFVWYSLAMQCRNRKYE